MCFCFHLFCCCVNGSKFSIYLPVSSLSFLPSPILLSFFSGLFAVPSIFVSLLSLYSNFLTHCSHHHTISLFSLSERKGFFIPPLSLRISIYRALSSISVSVHITLSFPWPFYLFHFHATRKQQNQSQGRCLSHDIWVWLILWFCQSQFQCSWEKQTGILQNVHFQNPTNIIFEINGQKAYWGFVCVCVLVTHCPAGCGIYQHIGQSDMLFASVTYS